MSQSRLSGIERGRELPADEWIEALEAAYGAPVSDWYGPRVARALDPDVLPGQVWADNDPRHAGRTLRVLEIVWIAGAESAVCAAEPSGRTVTIKTDRFRPVMSGYRRIS